jgi:hypothetical protein
MNNRLPNWIGPVAITVLVFALWIPHYVITTSQQTVVLTITLFAILWYTWETRKMQMAVRDQAKAASDQIAEITKQTEAITKQTSELIYQRRLSILPKFSIGFGRRQAPFAGKIFDCLEIVNIGNGTAVNISIDDIEVRYEAGATARIRFGKFLFIEPTRSNSRIDKVAAIPLSIDNENIINYEPDDFDAFVKALVPEEFRDEPTKFLQKHSKEKIAVLLRFQDIDGTRYEQSAIVGLDQNKPYPLELGVPRIQPDKTY